VGTRTSLARLVVRVQQLAGVDREATAADAGREPVAKPLKRGNATVDVLAPTAGQPLPVAAGRGPVHRKRRKRRTNPFEGNSRGTSSLDQRDPPKHCPLVATLVSRRSARNNQAFFLVEAKG
jgi:hypothetical protein